MKAIMFVKQKSIYTKMKYSDEKFGNCTFFPYFDLDMFFWSGAERAEKTILKNACVSAVHVARCIWNANGDENLKQLYALCVRLL